MPQPEIIPRVCFVKSSQNTVCCPTYGPQPVICHPMTFHFNIMVYAHATLSQQSMSCLNVVNELRSEEPAFNVEEYICEREFANLR